MTTDDAQGHAQAIHDHLKFLMRIHEQTQANAGRHTAVTGAAFASLTHGMASILDFYPGLNWDEALPSIVDDLTAVQQLLDTMGLRPETPTPRDELVEMAIHRVEQARWSLQPLTNADMPHIPEVNDAYNLLGGS